MPMVNLIERAVQSRADNMFRGVIHSMGMMPHTPGANGNMNLRWLGKEFSLGNTLGDITQTGSYDTNGINSFLSLAMLPLVGSSALSSPHGFMQGLLLETSVSGSMLKYGYSVLEHEGQQMYHIGRLPLVRRLKRRGIHGSLGFADMLTRYGWGSYLAQGAASALPGPLGLIAGGALGSIGARYGGLWGLGGLNLAYQSGKLMAKGTYSVLKAGYDHRQRQKRIQTDGDMSAFMTQGAFTMRERAVQAIQKSHLNARSALGQEASYMHNPQRSYSSPYRRFY